MWSAFYDTLMGSMTPEQRTSVWRIFITLALAIHIMFVTGTLPGVTSGFASLSSVAQLSRTLDTIQTNQIIEQIEKERRNVCKHRAENNQAALAYSVRKRDEMLTKYKKITGLDAQAVTCRELGYDVDG